MQAKEIVGAMIDHNLNLKGASDASYLVPMLWSLPGEGKTTVIRDIAKEKDLELVTVIFAQFDAGELGGFPIVDGATYKRARPFFMPTEGRGILFLDELPQAVTANQNIAAQLCNERRIGEHVLPEGWTVICAGNPMSARAGTSVMPSHLKDRQTHLDIETDHVGFREFALAAGFLPVITSFINERPEWLQKFDPSQNASPSPRSWERANSILSLGLSTALESIAMKGQLGEGAVADFTGYLRIWKDLPKSEDVINQASTHDIPEDSSILYALCSALAHKANKGNIKNILTYGNRFPKKEFTAFLMKDCIKRTPELATVKEVSDWFFNEGKKLML